MVCAVVKGERDNVISHIEDDVEMSDCSCTEFRISLEKETQCQCSGLSLLEVPSNLSTGVVVM
jgi:hypothetical protein